MILLKAVQLNFILFFLWFSAGAQVKITNDDTPLPGDTIRISRASATQQVDFQSTGNNKVWNFANVSPQSQEVLEYKLAKDIKFSYGLFFGSKAFGKKIADTFSFNQAQITDVYEFYDTLNNTFSAMGRAMIFQSFPVISKYKDKDEIYQFPLNYGDIDTSTFKVSLDLGSFLSVIQQGTRINEVDGWGKIITPYKSYDCIRIKTTIDETDSIKSSLPIPSVIQTKRITYQWLAKGEKEPVFKVEGTVGPFGNYAVTGISYIDRYRKIEPPINIQTDFIASNTNPKVNEWVYLTNQSTSFPGSSFTWEINPPKYEFKDSTDQHSENPIIAFNEEGTYDVKLTMKTILGTNSETKNGYITVNGVSGIQNLAKKKDPLMIIQNQGNLQLSLNDVPEGMASVRIYDLSSKIVFEKELEMNNGNGQFLINKYQFKKGIYLVQVKIDSNQLVKKIYIH